MAKKKIERHSLKDTRRVIPFDREHKEKVPHCTQIPDAPITEFLFSDIRVAWLWTLVRLYVGYTWLTSGWGKITNPAWVGENAGSAVTGFATRALEKASGPRADVQGWYAWFLENVVIDHASVFSTLVSFGEVLVGVALILGAFVGVAAFFGIFMNANFLLAGTISVNPTLLFWQVLLVLAYRTAGWYGLDRYILKYLGMPWAPGHLFTEDCECKNCS